MMRLVLMLALASLLAACTTTTNLAGVPEKPAKKAPPESRARVHTELAALYYQQASFKTALTEIDTALRIDADYAPAYDVRGLVYMQLGERGLASDSFRKAIELAPADPDIRNNYGWFLCTTGQPRAGLAQLELAWKNPLYDTPGRALANASRCAVEAGDPAQAKIYRERAVIYGETSSEPRTPENLSLPNNK